MCTFDIATIISLLCMTVRYEHNAFKEKIHRLKIMCTQNRDEYLWKHVYTYMGKTNWYLRYIFHHAFFVRISSFTYTNIYILYILYYNNCVGLFIALFHERYSNHSSIFWPKKISKVWKKKIIMMTFKKIQNIILSKKNNLLCVVTSKTKRADILELVGSSKRLLIKTFAYETHFKFTSSNYELVLCITWRIKINERTNYAESFIVKIKGL